MFTIIYEKSTGKVINITNESNAENLRAAIPESADFIFVSELPQVTPFRQKMVVENGAVIVKDLVLTAEQEKEIHTYEVNIKIEELKNRLASWDYKTSKYVDGEYSVTEWQQIVAERKALREQINALETELQ